MITKKRSAEDLAVPDEVHQTPLPSYPLAYHSLQTLLFLHLDLKRKGEKQRKERKIVG